MSSRIIRIIVPVLILAAGVAVTATLVASRPAPKKEAVKETGALVRVFEAERADRRAMVYGTGTVSPAREVTVMPQVSGRVTSMSPSLVSGGFFNSGDVLFEIEETDYRLALMKADAARANAEYELARIESQARVARAEWERLGVEGKDGEPNPLVLYEPQLTNARAALKSTEASVEQARLDLERTRVLAPFDCRVSTESVDPGQYVHAGSPVAELSGTSEAEISVPLPLDELSWIHIPVKNGGGKADTGSPAAVSVTIGGTTHVWRGEVTRSAGEVGMKDRMMNVVVTVADPYGLASGGKGGKPPLAVGTFVDVRIEGRLLEDVVTIPRTALRDGSTVWTVDGDGRLAIRKVEILRVEHEEVILSGGLEEGDRVVLTNLTGAADGMKLRIVEEGS